MFIYIRPSKHVIFSWNFLLFTFGSSKSAGWVGGFHCLGLCPKWRGFFGAFPNDDLKERYSVRAAFLYIPRRQLRLIQVWQQRIFVFCILWHWKCFAKSKLEKQLLKLFLEWRGWMRENQKCCHSLQCVQGGVAVTAASWIFCIVNRDQPKMIMAFQKWQLFPKNFTPSQKKITIYPQLFLFI